MNIFELSSTGFGGSKATKIANINPSIKDSLWFYYYSESIQVPVIQDSQTKDYYVMLQYDGSVPLKNIMADVVILQGVSEINTINYGNGVKSIMIHYNISNPELNTIKYKN